MIPWVRHRPPLPALAGRIGLTPGERRSRPRARRRPQLNLALLLGSLIWLVLYLLAVYGPLLAPHDAYFAIGQRHGLPPPYPPGPTFPLGSDELGHDVLSWLLIGARPTLLLVVGTAIVRLLLALPLGLVAGWRGGSATARGLTALAGAFTSVPAVVGAMLALLVVGVPRGWPALVAGLVAFGWAAPALLVRRSTLEVAGQDYIVAARSLGAGEAWLVRRHVLPNVLPSALPVLVLQISACLLLLTELGFLQLFLGGGVVMPFADGPRRVPGTPEWGGLLAQNQPLGLLFRAPWIVLAPVGAIALTAWGTSLLATGLTRYVRQRSVSQLIASRRTAGLVVLLILLALPSWHATVPDPANVQWARTFDGKRAAADLAALDSARFGGRAAGSPGAAAAASWLTGRFEAMGWQPAAIDGGVATVTLPVLTPQGAPALVVQAGGRALSFGPPQVSALAVPWSGGGTGTGALLFVGRPGFFHPGQRYRAGSGSDDAGKIVVLAPPTAAFPLAKMGVVLDSVANEGAAAALILDDEPAGAYGVLGPPGSAGPGSRRLPVLEVVGAAAQAVLAGSGVTMQNAAALADGPGFTPVPLAGQAQVDSGFSARPPVGRIVAMRLAGTAAGASPLLLVAAYDRVGAAGDASGAAVLLELARMLAAHPLPNAVWLVALPGGPPGDPALTHVLAVPPLANQPVALALRLDDVGGGGPLALGAFSPESASVELAASAARAAGTVGVPVQPVQPQIATRVAGSVSMDGFQPAGGTVLDGPAIAIAAPAAGQQPPTAAALAAAGRTAALLLLRAVGAGR